MPYTPKPLRTAKLTGISEKTMEIHHGKLYTGYVNKKNEISERLGELRRSGQATGNAVYSELRGLKQGETFAANGVYLHEWFFDQLGGDGDTAKAPKLMAAIVEKFGSLEDFKKYFNQCALAARGWAVLVWDMHEKKLMQYNADAQNQGAVWGSIPVLLVDVYEHAYFIDFGSDRAAYLEAFWQNLDWAVLEARFEQFSGWTL